MIAALSLTIQRNVQLRLACLGPGELLQQRVEIFQLGVFDDDLAAAVVVFDVDFQAEGALQALLHFADIGVNRRLGLGLLLGSALGMQQALNVGLGLANRKRKSDDTLGSLLDFLGGFEGKQRTGVAEAELAGLDAGLDGGG